MDKKEIQYGEIRKEIQNGDVLLYKGKGIASYCIKKFTHSEYSHAGLAVWWNERLMVMEAVGKGVVVAPLSTNVEHYHGDVELFRSKQEICADKRVKLIQCAQEELGKSFSQLGVLLIGFRIFLKLPFNKDDTIYTSKRLFCSFYVASAYNQIELDLKPNRSDNFTTPDDIAHSPLLEFSGVLKKFGGL